ncbi:MAG: alpha/beta hydrolase [Proteobacteria bacterium]|nr:alpha/beta hydrolase [Pseudomonadota bacterium]
MPFTDIDGIRLETRLIPGAADRPWLVLLHEGLGSVSLWRDFPDKLSRRLGMRTLVYSRRGYGRSDGLAGHRDATYLHHEALDVLPKLLGHFGIDQALLVGHSDGASIALIHAASHAETDLGIVLMAPHVFVEPISQAGIARAVEAYEKTDLRARLARHQTHVDDAFYGWSRTWLDPRFRTWSLGAECERLAVPTLLIQGDADEYGTLAQLDAIEASAKGPVRRLVLPCGHTPWREDEPAVLEAIAGFTGCLAH